MTDLSDRLKALQEAMTKGPWCCRPVLRFGEYQIYGPNDEDLALVYISDGADEPTIYPAKANATVIALGDLFIPLAMALDEVVAVWDSPKMLALWERTATLGEYDGPTVNMDNIRVLLGQIAERLTA